MTGERTARWALAALTALGLVGAVVASQLVVEAATTDDVIASTATGEEPGELASEAESEAAGRDTVDGADDTIASDDAGDGDRRDGGVDPDDASGPAESNATTEDEGDEAGVARGAAEGSDDAAIEGDTGDGEPEPLDCPPLFVLLFALDSADPDNADPARAADLAAWLTANPNTELIVDGHADAAGSEEANLRLSFRRAEAAAGLMVEAGVAPQRLQARGFGEYQPLPGEAPDSERNRRVTMQVPGREECPPDPPLPAADPATDTDEEPTS